MDYNFEFAKYYFFVNYMRNLNFFKKLNPSKLILPDKSKIENNNKINLTQYLVCENKKPDKIPNNNISRKNISIIEHKSNSNFNCTIKNTKKSKNKTKCNLLLKDNSKEIFIPLITKKMEEKNNNTSLKIHKNIEKFRITQKFNENNNKVILPYKEFKIKNYINSKKSKGQRNLTEKKDDNVQIKNMKKDAFSFINIPNPNKIIHNYNNNSCSYKNQKEESKLLKENLSSNFKKKGQIWKKEVKNNLVEMNIIPRIENNYNKNANKNKFCDASTNTDFFSNNLVNGYGSSY